MKKILLPFFGHATGNNSRTFVKMLMKNALSK